jgi:uncharacterized protein YjdB
MQIRFDTHARMIAMTAMCAAGVATASCGEKSSTESARVATVEVTPSATTVPVGSVMTLTAEPRDEAGNLIRGQAVYWSSSDTAVATVSSAGVVNARGSGEAQIAATAQGVSAVATIRVSDSPPVTQTTVTRIVVSPPSGVIRATGSAPFRQLQLSAVAYDAENRVVSGRTFVWSVNKPSVATVDANGLVVGVKEGQAVVTATIGGVSGSSDILVVK